MPAWDIFGRSGRSGLLVAALACAACTGGVTLPFPALPHDAPEFPGTSTAVYTRIARGANTCWFGPRGTLDRTYIWHARAEPEAKGGMAEILIHERVDKNQRGLKAFSVTIAPKGDGSAVSAQSLKIPADVGKQLTADAYRWAKGNIGCREGDSDWAPVAAATKQPAAPKKKPPKAGGGQNAENQVEPAAKSLPPAAAAKPP
jgi:hypothetical protein